MAVTEDLSSKQMVMDSFGNLYSFFSVTKSSVTKHLENLKEMRKTFSNKARCDVVWGVWLTKSWKSTKYETENSIKA